MKKFLLFSSIVCSATILLSNAFAQPYNFLDQLSSFGPHGDGSLRPGDQSFVTTGNFQRGVSYNPATGNLIFIDRQAGGTGGPNISGSIHVLNGFNGGELTTLNTNGMGGGDFADFCAAVADDGVVYVGNLVNNGTASPFKLYRWAGESSIDPPAVAFSGNPGHGIAQRWGDTMDIRGSGLTTQIILGSRSSGTNAGTNVAILTTVDGVNFTAATLLTDVGPNSLGGGIAFGAGNTFWAKDLDAPLRQFSFNLGAGTATTLHSWGADVLSFSRQLEPLAVDTANNLLASVEMTSGVDHVRLYDISNPNAPPALLDTKDFPVNNANGTTTKGYMDFGSSLGSPLLYVHDMNNGLLAFALDANFAFPFIQTQPASQRVVAGRTVTFQVLAYPASRYQWQRNGVDVPGATNSVLNFPSVQTANAGVYRVIVSNNAGSTTSDEATLSVINPADLFHLSPLWSAAPGTQPYVTSSGGANTPNERNIAYNSLSNQLYVVQKNGANFTVHVLNADNGTRLYTLKTNGVFLNVPAFSGSTGIAIDGIDVADDGAIYACNMTADSCGCANVNGVFRVYRWDNSDSNTLPVQVFQGDPAGQSSSFRWGDVIDARGSGLNTQILLDNQNTTARYMAILRPTDGTMATFSSSFFFQDTATPFGGSIGRSLEFGSGDTIWQKRKPTTASPVAALLESSFDFNAIPNISPVLATYTNFPSGLGLVGLDLSRNLAAGINFVSVTTTPDTLDLYEMSDPTTPLLLVQYNFPINHQANANFIGRVLFAGNRVFALDGNNGIVAFTIVSGPQSPPTILRQPQNARVVVGNSVSVDVVTADQANFQWQFNNANITGATSSTYTISSATTNDAGSYRVIVSNDAGSVTSTVATVTVLPAEGFPRLTPLWSLAPQSRSYLRKDTDSLGRTPLYRGIAYNPLSNQVYIISRTNQTVGLAVDVLDATTGADLYQLNISTISGGTIILLAMSVADDGALYAANMADGPNGGLIYNLYRWVNSDPNTVPALVYSGDPGTGITTAQRWGDTMDVRGSGSDTEVIIDANAGTLAAIFKTTDGTMSAFMPTPFAQTYGGGTIGRSLQFGASQTFWQKRRGDRLLLSQYDLGTQSSATLSNFASFPASLGPVDLDLAHKIMAGINMLTTAGSTPDTLDLYDVTDFNNPLRVAGYNFPTNSQPNGNAIGQVLFAGDKVYAVDGNNGIMAFTIVLPPGPSLTITRSGSNVILSWPSPSPGFVLQKNSTLSPLTWMDVGQTPTVVNGQNTVTEDASSGNKFYRLRKPFS